MVRDPGIEPGTFRVSVERSKPAELIAHILNKCKDLYVYYILT